jgi:hypothetical protein
MWGVLSDPNIGTELRQLPPTVGAAEALEMVLVALSYGGIWSTHSRTKNCLFSGHLSMVCQSQGDVVLFLDSSTHTRWAGRGYCMAREYISS